MSFMMNNIFETIHVKCSGDLIKILKVVFT